MPKFIIKSTRHIGGKLVKASPESPAEIELPTAKFLIKAPRCINGQYIPASPEFPAEIELPEGEKVDELLFPVDDPKALEKPKPHFVQKDPGGHETAASHFATPKTAVTEPEEPKGKHGHGKHGRATDKDL